MRKLNYGSLRTVRLGNCLKKDSVKKLIVGDGEWKNLEETS